MFKVGDKVTGFYKGDYKFVGVMVGGDAYGYVIDTEPFQVLGRIETKIWVGHRDLARTMLTPLP